MRAAVYIITATMALAAHSAFAQGNRKAAAFWKTVQAECDTAAAKPPSSLGQRIAQTAIDEFNSFGGHEIDSNGRLFHFGLTEAEHEVDNGAPARQAHLSQLGWWRVLKYWRALYGVEALEKLEVRAYRDASTATQGNQAAPLLRTSAAQLLRDADKVADPATREILREAALRAAIVDTPWSAAFVSYVIRTAGVTAKRFRFSNAHRDYIYDAFATSAAEVNSQKTDDRLYRACPLTETKPRAGDLICAQDEPALADASAATVRERILTELDNSPAKRTVRHTHCEVVARVDGPARKVYTISGNVYQAVSARKLNLRSDRKFSVAQKGHCGGAGDWTLPRPSANVSRAPVPLDKCSLNDEKWFVLLQLR
jgi:hypothetical protein